MIELGILENAFNISVERTVNELWQSSFSLPLNDSKVNLCSHLNYVEIISPTGRNYGLYRIMPTETEKNSDSEVITFTCEHVLSTLLDDVMDGYYQFSGYTTAQTIQQILNLQEQPRWVLGQVDFAYTYEYAFENENGLLAPLLSIPKAFNEPYEFTFDTTVYPWLLNLKHSSDVPVAEIRWGKDMIDFSEVSDPTDIVNYIIPKGSGEGVNQLTIARANSGVKYIKDDTSIATWGKRSYIWIDKSYEDPYLLKNRAQALLNEWKNPKISFEINAADLSVLPEYAHERKILNGVTRILVDDKEYYARIISEEIDDITQEYNVKYTISNKIDDIATTQTDLTRKISVTQAYSQGATNIFSFSYQDNADENVPAEIPFFIDDDVVNVNTCELTFAVKKFRGYTRPSTGGGGGVSNTTSVTIDTVPDTHYHEFTMLNHTHLVNIGIVEYNRTINSVEITVDGNTVPFTSTTGDRVNLIDYLEKSNGVVSRGRHVILIKPDGPARIEANVILRVFIQSRLGGTY